MDHSDACSFNMESSQSKGKKRTISTSETLEEWNKIDFDDEIQEKKVERGRHSDESISEDDKAETVDCKYRRIIYEYQKCQEGRIERQVKSWKLNHGEVRRAIARMIIIDALPFKFVENQGFKQLMSVICDDFVLPSCITISRDCYKLYVDERKKLKEFLMHKTQRVSITINIWRSHQKANYMCVTCHFLDDDWRLHRKILNFCAISSYEGEDIALAVNRCLIGWGLDHKLFTVTVDNASGIDIACKAMINAYNEKQGNCLFNCGKYLHVKCIVHILDSLARDGLKVVGNPVKKVRAAVKYIKQFPDRLQRFQECVSLEGISSKSSLVIDVPTRWDSTYLMLSAALAFEKAFVRYADGDPHFKKLKYGDEHIKPPNSNDWGQVKHLCTILKKIYQTILRLSNSLHVTSNLLFSEILEIHEMFKSLEHVNESIDLGDAWDEVEDDLRVTNFKDMTQNMRMKWEKYYDNLEKMNFLIYLAVIFDPRFKLLGLEVCFRHMLGELEGMTFFSKVKKEAEALFEEYLQLYKPISLKIDGQNGDALNENVQKDSFYAIGSQTFFERIQAKAKLLRSAERGRPEFQKYLNEELQVDIGEDFDVLLWWKLNGPRFPIVAKMARDVLAMPVSSVTSEFAFLAEGLHLDSFRSSLSPKMVQALICGQDWLKMKCDPPNPEAELEESKS